MNVIQIVRNLKSYQRYAHSFNHKDHRIRRSEQELRLKPLIRGILKHGSVLGFGRIS